VRFPLDCVLLEHSPAGFLKAAHLPGFTVLSSCGRLLRLHTETARRHGDALALRKPDLSVCRASGQIALSRESAPPGGRLSNAGTPRLGADSLSYELGLAMSALRRARQCLDRQAGTAGQPSTAVPSQTRRWMIAMIRKIVYWLIACWYLLDGGSPGLSVAYGAGSSCAGRRP
jgi:hypothetical protein